MNTSQTPTNEPDNVKKKVINVDFDEIRDIAHKGVRRAAIFLGLGINAAYDKDFTDYRLSKITQFDLVRADATAEQISEFKIEFSYWIIGNGLRELIETYNIFLDNLFEACLLFKMLKAGSSKEEYRTAVKAFHRAGLDGKLDTLRTEFDLSPNRPDYLTSINKARNCLTHRRGIIGRQDVGPDGKFHLKWKGIEIFIQTPKGKEIPLPIGKIDLPIHLEDGGDVMLRYPERLKTFALGDKIILTPMELSEICQVITHETDILCKAGVTFTKELGFPHLEKVSITKSQSTPNGSES